MPRAKPGTSSAPTTRVAGRRTAIGTLANATADSDATATTGQPPTAQPAAYARANAAPRTSSRGRSRRRRGTPSAATGSVPSATHTPRLTSTASSTGTAGSAQSMPRSASGPLHLIPILGAERVTPPHRSA
jgi:hypothetical protein